MQWIAYHGTESPWRGKPRIVPSRGLFFSTDPAYAAGYGPIVYKVSVTLNMPRIYSEAQSQGNMELDLRMLKALGYDGRVVQYDDGNADIIVFSQKSFVVLETLRFEE